MLRALQSFCEKDGPDFVHHRLLVGPAARRMMYPDQYGSGGTGNATTADVDDSPEHTEGVLTKLVTKLMSLPPDSAYRYWITSCVQVTLSMGACLSLLTHVKPTRLNWRSVAVHTTEMDTGVIVAGAGAHICHPGLLLVRRV